jgi:hypothetical protein
VTKNDRIKELAEHIAWAAQTVHQAYHHGLTGKNVDLDTVTWQECPRDICLSARSVLTPEEPAV